MKIFLWQSLKRTFEMIKFSHTIFALPFALAALFFASEGLPSLRNLLLIVLAMVFARNTAMAANRWLDADFDAKNPRTAQRHLPQGLLTKKFVGLFTIANGALFIAVSSLFNSLTLYLSPLVLAILVLYSTTKRWTDYTQLYLGFCLGMAPLGVWIAIKGTLSLLPIFLSLGVLFWVAGFDLLYATQDYDFDRKANLKSLVVRWGIPNSLKWAKRFHWISVLFFILLGITYDLHLVYFLTMVAIAGCLQYEHYLINPDDLSKINVAFFNVNGLIGILFLMGVIAETLFYF